MPIAIAAILLLALSAAGVWYFFIRTPAARADVLLHKVKREPLVVSVTEKGTVESADNRDIICRVRAGTKGYASTITWVIDDGARVKPGQLIMILDDSALKDLEENQQILVQTAFSNKVKAEKDYEIAVKTNELNVTTARTALVNAENALENFTALSYDPSRALLGALGGGAVTLSETGTFQQEVDTLSGQVRQAEADVEQNREYSAWADNMVKLSYMPPTQAQAAKNRLDSSVENLRGLRAKLRQLTTTDRKQRLTNLVSERDKAVVALQKAELEASASLVKAEAERERATSEYFQLDEKLRDIKQQRGECQIYAPKDIEPGSMVVYYKQESSRFRNTTEGMIEQGAQVKEGQKLLRIPNLRRMVVNTKVHEAMVARIRGDVRVPTYFVDTVQAVMLFNTDPFTRLVSQNQEVSDRIRQRYRNLEYRKVSDGQKAMIRVDALSNRMFEGHVRTVANVASQTDSWISDTKLYQTYVTIDFEVLPDGTKREIPNEQLKPDMTAEVNITVDTTKELVLTVPVQAVMGGTEMGAKREVFVKTPSGYDRRQVVLGIYNEKFVEIREGVAEGDEIVINPKVLLEDDKTKTRDQNTDTKNGNNNGEGKGDYQKGDFPPKGDFPQKGDFPKGTVPPGTTPTGPKKGKKGAGGGAFQPPPRE